MASLNVLMEESPYGLNDSFIDDEEEEDEPTDEDSDWEPGKEDLEKEDTEELLKETKNVYKRKKSNSSLHNT
uniref:Uncharacterized protein n=1 Tax=Catagonus wagneri TaxID=51154 RepID=A0A8C4FGN2_9CETA